MEMNGLFYLSAVSVAITSLVKVPLKRVQIQVKKRVFNQETVFILGVDAATAVEQGEEGSIRRCETDGIFLMGEELKLLLPHQIDQELQHGHQTKIFELTLSCISEKYSDALKFNSKFLL